MESENYGLLPKHAGVRFIGFKSFGIPPGRAGLLLRKEKKNIFMMRLSFQGRPCFLVKKKNQTQ